MSSSGSQQTVQNYGAVSAAKAALESHTRQLAELAIHGVAVNAAGRGDRHPGVAQDPGQRAAGRQALRRNPSKRLTTPEDVAIAVRALCAPDLQWITGTSIRSMAANCSASSRRLSAQGRYPP